MSKKEVLKGVLHLHSETGTEGGYWAFQDQRFISKAVASFGLYTNQTVWDSNDPERKGKVGDKIEVFLDGKWLPYPDPMWEDPDYAISSLWCGERDGDREADKRLMKKYGFCIKYSADRMDERHGKGNWYLEDNHTAVTTDGTRWHYGGTPSTEPQRPYGMGQGRATIEWEDGVTELNRSSDTLLVKSWSYEGLNILENGDLLTIHSPDDPTEVVWQGTINLKQHDLFTEHAFGFWIHADQRGIERDVWARYFLEEYPAELIKVRKS